MLRQALVNRKIGPKSVRWRQHAPTRIEGFTDSVFAFAVTLIVVSLEVPETYSQLLISMRGFIGFAICFILMMLIWFDQYMFFRKYGLQDVRTIFLNSMLLFVVLFYVYPLKFLFSFLTQGNDIVHSDGEVIRKFSRTGEIDELMMIYGGGFVVIYSIFLLMHRHALKKREELQLNALEIFNTKTAMLGNISMIGVGVLSVLFAILGSWTQSALSIVSGLSYALIGPALSIVYRARMKKMKRIFSQEEIDQVVREHLVIEVKNPVS